MNKTDDFNLKFLYMRNLLDKDWKYVISWLEHEWGSANTILKLASEMKHCQQMVAVDNRTDIPLSYVSVANFKKFAYIGLYITDPNYRGRGVGSSLWKYVMNMIGTDKNIHLKSEPFMSEIYRRSNFTFTGDVTCHRYVGKMNENILENAIRKHKTDKCYSLTSAIFEKSNQKIAEYDSNVRGENMADFFEVWLNRCQPSLSNPNPYIFTVFATNENGQVVGYGSIVRLTKYSLRIGPLLADNFEIFLLILKELISHKFNDGEENDELSFNVPSVNQPIIDFLIEANFKLLLTIDRLFTKKVEDFQFDKIYCFAGHLGVAE